LSANLKRKYIEILSDILDKKRDYKARAGIKKADGSRRMEEITIMKQKCIELKDYILSTKQLPASVQIQSSPQR